MSKLFIILSIALLSGCDAAPGPLADTSDAKCSGGKYCSACKKCSYCKHCNSGGSVWSVFTGKLRGKDTAVFKAKDLAGKYEHCNNKEAN